MPAAQSMGQLDQNSAIRPLVNDKKDHSLVLMLFGAAAVTLAWSVGQPATNSFFLALLPPLVSQYPRRTLT
jgi:hypothetical protein